MKDEFLLKSRWVFILICFVLLSCSTKNKDTFEASADFYKNLFTGKILSRSEFSKFRDSLISMSLKYNQVDSMKSDEMQVIVHFYHLLTSNDSSIQEFKYSIRVGNEYIVRQESVEKIGMDIPQRTFLALDGENIQIGGRQTKPILLNLWFVGCRGCEQEMPSLNKLREKYADKVDFIAMTFDDEKRVAKFLQKKEFKFKHIVNVDDEYIKQIGTSPYPENIFISKDGKIQNVEGGLSDSNISQLKYFEALIEKLLISNESMHELQQ